MRAAEAVRRLWTGPGGVREVLAMAYPLILSHMSFTVQVSVDRLFLTWYSPEAVAGAVTGLFLTWSVVGVFLGTGEYVTAFVAQYVGSERPRRVGAAVWQGIYFAALSGLVVAALHPALPPLFELAGHDPAVRLHEVAYSRILMLGAMPIVLMVTLSTFFTGRGDTGVVLRVNVLATLVNVILDYFWIFGHGGFPRAGAVGAALATVASQVVGSAVYVALILRRDFRARYATLSAWRLEPDLFRRLLRYGLPTGLQYSMEILAFAVFMLIVGRLGTAELAASSIAFNLNMIVFMPMLGLGIGVSSLVARYLGAESPELAERSTWSAFWVSLFYMSLCGAAYLFAPGLLLAPYVAGSEPGALTAVTPIAVVLLRFVAIYSIFDMMNVIFAAGLKGAGDTRYPLAATLVLGWAAMLVPAWVACAQLGAGVYAAWTAASAYVVLLGLLMLLRFRAGRWRLLRIVEPRRAELEGAAEPA